MERIAWLGTGLLGGGFVEGLCKRGVNVDAWNRTAAKAQALTAHGAKAHVNIVDAVKNATRVHICVSDDAAVDALLDQMLPALPRDVLVVDHTTVLPLGVEPRVKRMAAKGVSFIHAPVFMAPEHAKNAGGMMMVSGARALVDRVKPVLATMTGKVLDMGEQPGRAAAFKLMGNCMIVSMAAGLSDILVLSKATGVEFTDAIDLFKDFPVSGQIPSRGMRMAKGDFNASFELSMARKDVRLMTETAAHVPTATLTLLPAVGARMDALIAGGAGDKDLAALALDLFVNNASK